MAVRKTNTKKAQASIKKPRGKDAAKLGRVPVPVIFWVFLFIVLITAFFAMLPRVIKGVNLSPKQTVTEQPSKQPPPVEPPSSEKPPAPKTPDTETRQELPQEKPAPENTVEQKPSQSVPQPPPSVSPPSQQQPAPPQQPQNPPPIVKPPETERPAEIRDVGIYFIQERAGGAELSLVKVNRKIRVSASPLRDSINALLSGPNAEEKSQGIISLIPAESRIISLSISENTAQLNFNEEFRYNTLGKEGSDAQIKQIVWTATEFPNIRNVQFLIEGERVNLLIEGVRIWSPIGR
jgi:spore germination protein GerM